MFDETSVAHRWVVQHTTKYPPAQPVTIIPIATDTLCEPNTVPTTVGIVAKKPPLAAPLIMTKTTSGPSESETGQITNMLTVVRKRPMKSVFRGPKASAAMPELRRPTAEERLKPATRAAPVLEERSREAL